MNKLYYFLITISIAFFASCADEVDTDKYFLSSGYLTIDKTSITMEGTASTAELSIKANCRWTITGLPDWLSASQQSGDNSHTITLSATKNSSFSSDRNAMITIQTDDGLHRQVAVRQSRLTETLTVSVSELLLSTAGEQKTFVVQSNTAWTIMGVEPWFLLSTTKGEGNQEVTVQAIANTSEDERSAILTVHGTDRSATITLRQAGIDVNLTATPLSLNFDALSQTKALQLSGTARWAVTTNADWVSIDKLDGTGTSTLNITCADNFQTTERTAVITITWKSGKIECVLKQAAATLPQLTETQTNNVDRYSATVTSTVTWLFPLVERGFYYSNTHQKPTTADQVITATTSTTGTLTANLVGLQSHTHYYVRSYAVSAAGTAYGPVSDFTTIGGVPGEDDNPKPNL